MKSNFDKFEVHLKWSQILGKFSNRQLHKTWREIFFSMSMSQFYQVCDLLDFPLYPSESVRQFAQDFGVAYWTYIVPGFDELLRAEVRKPIPEASIDLLDGMATKVPYERLFPTLLIKTFVQLEREGCADEIYRWGRQTWVNHNRADTNALSVWNLLLTHWAIYDWTQDPALSTLMSNVHEYDDVIARWLPIYQNEFNPWDDVIALWLPIYPNIAVKSIEPLTLPAEVCVTLRKIILKQGQRHLQLEAAVEQIQFAPKTEWEEYIFVRGVPGWIWHNLEGGFRISLRTWNNISAELTSTEMQTLEQWGLRQKDRKYFGSLRHLKVPLPDFLASDE